MSDARFKTMRHIETVRNYLGACIRELLTRQEQHDQSKLAPPEVEAYEAITHQLRGLTYGSDAYRAVLKAQQPAIAHHYQHNRHHPEFHQRGYRDMTLIDLLEMLVDWRAASLRREDGAIQHSLVINQTRFGYSDDLAQIFRNTMTWLDTQDVYHKADES
jgi:hypothetical protein